MTMLPGARTLTRMPAPAHCGETALRRAHRVTAIFELAYAKGAERLPKRPSPAAQTTPSSRPPAA
ncbi:hypothetical protein OOK41_24320 [Micromonospora sp. NBC_01655]|uniref:hypothetical protein n=1 Tax=Micromonospora sp. NBC_01655 TaxID=2975983 RepID=UPI0022549FFE|nr:hypothetical protein [Micromonospora sp. NBC_01655]MCX4473392.1 hypothetical protein [Micromonospora sp. NBC_01655]